MGIDGSRFQNRINDVNAANTQTLNGQGPSRNNTSATSIGKFFLSVFKINDASNTSSRSVGVQSNDGSWGVEAAKEAITKAEIALQEANKKVVVTEGTIQALESQEGEAELKLAEAEQKLEKAKSEQEKADQEYNSGASKRKKDASSLNDASKLHKIAAALREHKSWEKIQTEQLSKIQQEERVAIEAFGPVYERYKEAEAQLKTAKASLETIKVNLEIAKVEKERAKAQQNAAILKLDYENFTFEYSKQNVQERKLNAEIAELNAKKESPKINKQKESLEARLKEIKAKKTELKSKMDSTWDMYIAASDDANAMKEKLQMVKNQYGV